MSTTILLSVALQDWERYSTHALAAREVAATLAKGAATPLQVLSVYDYEREYEWPPVRGLPPEMAEVAIRYGDDMRQRTDDLMARKLHDFLAPLKDAGLAVHTILRVGNPREVIVETARSVKADLLVIGSHSKRGLLDVALGGTARHLTSRAPCTVLMVSPKA